MIRVTMTNFGKLYRKKQKNNMYFLGGGFWFRVVFSSLRGGEEKKNKTQVVTFFRFEPQLGKKVEVSKVR